MRRLFASFVVCMLYHAVFGSAVGAEWSLEQYVAIGFPTPDRPWGQREYRKFQDAVMELVVTDRSALPRFNSGASEALFLRISDPRHAEILSDTTRPSEERAKLFVMLFNLNPLWQKLYRPSLLSPAQTREAFALETTYVLMFNAAVRWDRRALPRGPQDREPFILRFTNLDDTYFAANVYLTLDRMIPRLWNGVGLRDEERRRGAGVLIECLPTIWPLLSTNHQSDIRNHLQTTYRQVKDPETKRLIKGLVTESPPK